MLVLSRRECESLVVGGDIEVEVLQIRGRKVRLGIRAPGSFRVMRCELETGSDERLSYLPPTEKLDESNGDSAPLRRRLNALRQRPR